MYDKVLGDCTIIVSTDNKLEEKLCGFNKDGSCTVRFCVKSLTYEKMKEDRKVIYLPFVDLEKMSN